MADIDKIHDELEALNRKREAFEAEARAKALDLATKRNLMYREAVAKRDAIVQRGLATIEGVLTDGEDPVRLVREVQVYDPDLLDKETLAVLAHMGTPIPPVDEVFPDGVTIPGKGGK